MESISNLTIVHPLFLTWKQDLVASDFFTDCRFFRVLPGFVAQFGINVRTDSKPKEFTYCVGSHTPALE
jgi:cyclophilin family peptidyl-prolyl cis-trans isomerase